MTQLPDTTLDCFLSTYENEYQETACSLKEERPYRRTTAGNLNISKPKELKNDFPKSQSRRDSLFSESQTYEESPLRWVLLLGLISLNIIAGFSNVMYISIPENALTYFSVDESTLL
jgi:hypothetical protein